MIFCEAADRRRVCFSLLRRNEDTPLRTPAGLSQTSSYLPVFDEGLEVQGETHAERQQRRVFLQDFGQNLKVCLTVLVRKLSRGQLHLKDAEDQSAPRSEKSHKCIYNQGRVLKHVGTGADVDGIISTVL